MKVAKREGMFLAIFLLSIKTRLGPVALTIWIQTEDFGAQPKRIRIQESIFRDKATGVFAETAVQKIMVCF